MILISSGRGKRHQKPAWPRKGHLSLRKRRFIAGPLPLPTGPALGAARQRAPRLLPGPRRTLTKISSRVPSLVGRSQLLARFGGVDDELERIEILIPLHQF